MSTSVSSNPVITALQADVNQLKQTAGIVPGDDTFSPPVNAWIRSGGGTVSYTNSGLEVSPEYSSNYSPGTWDPQGVWLPLPGGMMGLDHEITIEVLAGTDVATGIAGLVLWAANNSWFAIRAAAKDDSSTQWKYVQTLSYNAYLDYYDCSSLNLSSIRLGVKFTQDSSGNPQLIQSYNVGAGWVNLIPWDLSTDPPVNIDPAPSRLWLAAILADDSEARPKFRYTNWKKR